MLWNTLIVKITTFVDAHPEHPGAAVLTAQAKEAHLTVHQLLRNMDIRKVGVLRELVPEAFPRPLRNRERLLRLDQNIHGKWRVDLQEKPHGKG